MLFPNLKLIFFLFITISYTARSEQISDKINPEVFNINTQNKNIKLKPRLERKRHVAKTITWRIVASLDTFILSWLLTGSASIGMTIASLEILTKMVLYYAHERQWEKPEVNLFVLRQFQKAESLLKKRGR